MLKKIGFHISKYFFKDILDKQERRTIKNKFLLIEKVSQYYVSRFSKERLKLKYIEYKSEYEDIETTNNIALKLSILSLVLTVSFNAMNFFFNTFNQNRVISENKITRTINLENNYKMKKIEAQNELKFSKDDDRKEQLEDFINDMNIQIVNVSKYDNNGINDMLSLNNIIVILYVIGIFMIFMLVRLIFTGLKNLWKKQKKKALKLKIDIIETLLN